MNGYNFDKESQIEYCKNIKIERFDNGVNSFLLDNGKGLRAAILNYGAAIAKLEVPDRNGNIADIVLGHENPRNFPGGRFYFGATIGRFANRIAGGRFKLNGKEYNVTRNRMGNLLHGGAEGFDKKFWKSNIREGGNEPALELSHVSSDGDEGFPGNMEIKVIYTLTCENELKMEYEAVADKTTVINITNHSYFNLTGNPAESILGHVLTINADKFIPIDQFSIPSGEIADIAGTQMDFRKPFKIGSRINDDFEQLKITGGYDHNCVIKDFNGQVREAAELYEPESGRVMQVFTDQPGLQFYSGNYLDGSHIGKKGIAYKQRSGLCLECQHFPNSPNEKKFPTVILTPGQVYRQTTIYKFSII